MPKTQPVPYAEWGQLKFVSVTPERRAVYEADHRTILDALMARDSERARRASEAHIRHGIEFLFVAQ